MMKFLKRYGGILLTLLSLVACSQPQQKGKGRANATPPSAALAGYDLSHPEIFRMETSLDEISGISMRAAHGDTIFAIQDEEGYLFRFLPGSGTVTQTKFGKQGDYEDVQLMHSDAIVLRSDGRLYRFPLESPDPKHAAVVDEQKDLLPAGEYEGLYADEKNNRVYVLCKHCGEKTSKSNSVFAFDLSPQGAWNAAGVFTINVREIESITGDRKIDFHPSALTQMEKTGQWLILSSVNKILVVADSNWNVSAVIPLPPAMFNQPEGIAFDQAGTLYISNEKGSRPAATVLKFVHHL